MVVAGLTVIVAVVAPVLHVTTPSQLCAVNTTGSPEHIDSFALAITGAAG